MKSLIKLCSGLFLTTSLLTMTGCDKLADVQPEPANNGTARVGDFGISNGGFDVALFASKIEAQLTNKVTGYGYRIIVNGKPYTVGTGGDGFARHLIDAPGRIYTPTVRQDIGGSTQFLTAMLVMKILERYNLSVDEKVWPYLPTYFKPSLDFKKVTFRDLLAHTSGVIDYNNANDITIEDVQDSVENGIYDQGEETNIGGLSSGPKPYGQYYNQPMNYMLLRHAIVYVEAKKSPNNNGLDFLMLKESRADKSGLYDLVRHTFKNHIAYDILQPAGLTKDQAEAVGDYAYDSEPLVKYYPVAHPTQPGSNAIGTGWSKIGASFLYLSADEMGRIMTAARAGKIVSPAVLSKMKAGDGKGNQMGFDDAIAGQHGKYYYKKGVGSGGNVIVMDFDGPQANIQLAITTNNANGLVTNAQAWATAFDASWK
ncbi:MAG TPA: serine hydrolase [Fibrella sp.]